MVQIRSNSLIHGPAMIQTVRSAVQTRPDCKPLDRSWTMYGPAQEQCDEVGSSSLESAITLVKKNPQANLFSIDGKRSDVFD